MSTRDNVPAIELRGVTKKFGRVVANDNVSLTVERGEILSILGENGSGKTTLMNIHHRSYALPHRNTALQYCFALPNRN